MVQRPKIDRISAGDRKLYPGLMEPSESRITIERTIAYH
jgi:hypothetical protein